jgi:hypothetical protein
MKELGSATEDEMVLAFLKAEIDSPCYGPCCQSYLTRLGLDRKPLIDEADIGNAKHNQIRLELLKKCRGYKANQYLFTDFPGDVQWRRVELEPGELKRLKYINLETWTTLTGKTRRVVDGARNVGTIPIDEDTIARIKAVADRITRGDRFPELIVVEGDGQDLILLEGHTRATAYVLAEPSYPIELLVGSSREMNKWHYY